MEIIKRFLEGSVVIPYSSDLLSLIKEACHAYISEDEEDKYADIEKMAEYYATNERKWKNYHWRCCL